MLESSARGAKECAVFGVIAGTIFLLVQEAFARVMGFEPVTRMYANAVLGPNSMQLAGPAAVVFGSTLTHLTLCGAYGALYGFVNGRLSASMRTNFWAQAAIGTLCGIAFWLVNVQIFARLFYPSFLGTRQFVQVLFHVAFFGAPLAMLYAGTERRLERLRGTPTAA